VAEMLTPLHWSPPELDIEVVDDNPPANLPFRWPTPPFACYAGPVAHTDALPCEIAGLNGMCTTGRLTFFVPEETVAHVQVPPARTTLPLRFDQFRAITLTSVLEALDVAVADPHADMLSHRAVSGYRVSLAGGGELRGDTVGHVDSPHGLFLFPPADAQGGVRRMFIPRAAIERYETGPRIGEVLVEQQAATPQQVEHAAAVQQEMRCQKIGDILVARQIVTPQQLFDALDQQATMPLVRIGDALISLGLITEAQLTEALSQQQRDRSLPLGEVLVRMGVVAPDDLQVALARKMGYPLVNLDVFPVETEALRKLAYEVALRLRVMPLLLRDGRLVVALDDPARRRLAVEEVEFTTQMKVVPVLAQCKRIDEVISAAYEKIGAAGTYRWITDAPLLPATLDLQDTDKLVESLEKETRERISDDDKPIEQSDNSLVRLINNMIIEAHKDGVSDIHLESYPGREKIRIRFRKDGLLRTYLELPANYRNALISRVKIMCDLDISERRKPQDGKVNFAKFSPSHKIELRVATIPTNNGLEDVVMRILASAKPIPLDRLGLSPRNLAQVKHAVERPYGLMLCVGPTGSGKTTTLHSALSHINVPERKIWTAEDPIEITQPGLRQVQVNPKIDWTFAKALRAFLRADPDVIMVGEVRDQETAQMAIEASLTGHLVLSTLHTNSATETVTRLLDMGMDPFNFADSLLGVLAQRLVRQLCPHCRVSRPATKAETEELMGDYLRPFSAEQRPSRESLLADWIERFGSKGRVLLHHSPGCKQCDNTGFQGRAGIHELMVISRELRRLVQTGARADALQQVAMAEGMRTLRQDGIEKVLAGVTTIEEVRATSNV
jgi:type II secretory ATPase GspE/PulE/Tfp pilus assembly ATPase PilB-like protein